MVVHDRFDYAWDKCRCHRCNRWQPFFYNTTSQTLNLVYLPSLLDTDGDRLPDVWEMAHGSDPYTPDATADPDGDGFSTGEEYRTGTDPQLATSHPEGVNGVNYVLFRDVFSDATYEDRWYAGYQDVDPGNTNYSVIESGTQLRTTIQKPGALCLGERLQSFVTVDAVNFVFHAKLKQAASGTQSVGFMQGVDVNNRIEIQVDADQAPYLVLRSWDAGVLTEVTPANDSNLQGTNLDIRLVKKGAVYSLFSNGVYIGAVTNIGIGDVNLRPYLWQQICSSDPVLADGYTDLVEILLDRDADGRADLEEDVNINGGVDPVEADPLNPGMDTDTV